MVMRGSCIHIGAAESLNTPVTTVIQSNILTLLGEAGELNMNIYKVWLQLPCEYRHWNNGRLNNLNRLLLFQ